MADLFARVAAALSGRYSLEREVGSGGMATVYLATDVKHRRRVAVKVLKPEVAKALGTDRFLREIEIVSQLHHPHILPLYDSGEADGFLYFVMPYVEGESVRQRLEREQQLPVDEALQIASEVAEALSYSHSMGIVHRDIKPENILLESGHALVTDFGVARVVFDVDVQRITETGIAVGTPAYMSPEQAAGNKRIDGRSDVYSLACVLYEMLAGEPPHTGPTPQAILARQLTGEVRSITPLRSTVQPALDANIRRALAPAPADRYATPTQFVEALLADRPIVPPRVLWRRWVRRAAIGVASVALVGAVAIGVRTIVRLPEVQAGERPVTLAVFPFRGTGPEAGSLGEGVADMLAAALDGTIGMAVSDPTALWRPLRRSQEGLVLPPDVAQALELAQRVSARGMVLGSVLGAGGRLEIAARVYKGDSLTTTLTASTSVDSLVQAMNQLAIDVVAALWERDTLPTVPVIEQIATQSMVAMQAYLRGMHLKRAGQYQAADEEMRRAAELDSTFALAYMEWFAIRSRLLYLNAEPYIGLRPMIEHAMRHRDRLTARNRLRVEAMRALDDTDGATAAERLERVLELDSMDVEALGSLAFTYLRDGWQLGKELNDISAATDRLLRVDSASLTGRLARVDLAYLANDQDRFQQELDYVRAADTASAVVRGTLQGYAILGAPAPERARLIRAAAQEPIGIVTTVLRSLRSHRPALAELFLDELRVDTMPVRHRQIGINGSLQLWLAEGRLTAVDSVLRAGTFEAPMALRRHLVVAFLSGVGDSALAANAVGELARYLPADSLDEYFETRPAWITGWTVGAYQATVGDTVEARVWQRALEQLPAGGTPADYRGSLSADIEARIAVRRGDRQTARAAAQRAYDLWTIHSNNFQHDHPELAMRFHRGQVLQALGSEDQAAALYRSLCPPHGWNGFHTARGAFEVAEIARARGDLDEAARFYRIAESLWERGDPDVVGSWLDRAREGQRSLGVR